MAVNSKLCDFIMIKRSVANREGYVPGKYCGWQDQDLMGNWGSGGTRLRVTLTIAQAACASAKPRLAIGCCTLEGFILPGLLTSKGLRVLYSNLFSFNKDIVYFKRC
jgi:hypothetical protein